MRFITSLSRNRIDRQQYCIGTWKGFASEIVVSNTKKDIEFLKPYFPDVRFEECPSCLTGDQLYNRPDRSSIYALAQCGPGLLINSDIKIDGIDQKSFLEAWKQRDRTLKVGIRLDFDGPGKPKTLNPYGIDAFLLTESIIDRIPQLGFVIGTSVWDYWLIWHFVAKHSFFVEPIQGHMLHLNHQSSWNAIDTAIGDGILKEHYGLDSRMLSRIVKCLTNR